MDEKNFIKLLNDNSGLIENKHVIPNRMIKELSISWEQQAAIEYLSFLAFPFSIPNETKKRDAFIEITQLAILRTRIDDLKHQIKMLPKSDSTTIKTLRQKIATLKKIINEHTKGSEWKQIHSKQSPAIKRIAKAFIHLQCFKDYKNYLCNAKDRVFNWNDFLIRAMAFYLEYEGGFPFQKSSLDYKSAWLDRANHPLDSNFIPVDIYESMRSVDDDFYRAKPMIHLLDGLHICLQKYGIKKIPHIYDLIKNPFWVAESIYYSQLYLGIMIHYDKEKESSIGIDLDFRKMHMLYLKN